MPLEQFLPLTIPPGIFRNGTTYQTKGRWSDANLIRFQYGTIGPIGGWTRATYDGTGIPYPPCEGCPRGAYAYTDDTGAAQIIIGTTEKLYAISQGSLSDITPVTLTPGLCSGQAVGGGGAYGDGVYGAGPYGAPSSVVYPVPGDTWSLDNFGGYLVGVLSSDRQLWVWDGLWYNPPFVAPNSPTQIRGCMVTPERFLFTFGGIDATSGGNPNPRLVQWAKQETYDEWDGALPTTTAGNFPLTTPGVILAGRRTRRATIIWTDLDVWTAQYIGGTYLYQFDQVGNYGLLAPNAVAVSGDRAYWMGTRGFFLFDGLNAQPMECPVQEHVFARLDITQRAQIHCQVNKEFHEVTWHYPTGTGSPEDSSANDSYVTYNYREDHWTIGSMSRETGVDRGASPSVLMVDPAGIIWKHEDGFGFGDGTPFIESGPLEVGLGDQLMRVQRIIPDERTRGDLSMEIRTSLYPTDPATLSPPISLNGAAPIDVRLTARQMQFKFTQANATDWRLGNFRLGARPQGRR